KRQGRRTKTLLVEACRDLLPAAVYERPKMGFGLPMDEWMRGPLLHFVEVGLQAAESRAGLSREVISCIYHQFKARNLHWTRVWSLVVLGHYLAKVAQPHDVPSKSQDLVCEFSAPSVR